MRADEWEEDYCELCDFFHPRTFAGFTDETRVTRMFRRLADAQRATSRYAVREYGSAAAGGRHLSVQVVDPHDNLTPNRWDIVA